MIAIIVYFIFAFGLTEILVFYEGPFNLMEYLRRFVSKISHSFGKVFECPICTSSWVGVFSSMINYFLIPINFTPWNIILANTNMWYFIFPMDLFTTAGVVLLLYHLDELITRKYLDDYDE